MGQTANHSFQDRQLFFEELSNFWQSISCNGPKCVIGDMNSRLYRHISGEDHIIGPNITHQSHRAIPAHANRSLLIEFCTECELLIANTFRESDEKNSFTYKEIWYKPGSQMTSKNHEMLDLVQ